MAAMRRLVLLCCLVLLSAPLFALLENPTLLEVARSVRSSYARGTVGDGIIGSSDMWIDELDRVAQFHERFGTSVEEMETASAAQVAAQVAVPFVGIRVLSDNITNASTCDPKAGEACDRKHSTPPHRKELV